MLSAAPSQLWSRRLDSGHGGSGGPGRATGPESNRCRATRTSCTHIGHEARKNRLAIIFAAPSERQNPFLPWIDLDEPFWMIDAKTKGALRQ